MAICQVNLLSLVPCIVLFSFLKEVVSQCNRTPFESKAQPLPPDDRFEIEVNGIIDNNYIPNKQYKVTLKSTNNKTTFIAFSIWASGDTMENPNNRRKPILLQSGMILPHSRDSIVSSTCNNTVMQSDIMPKLYVDVIWKSPGKGNKCVTIFALVAVEVHVWYNNEGPLNKKVCEDSRQEYDMQPQLNNKDCECLDARYKLTFEGHWTPNTHPYPNFEELARFSDVVGASHTNKFELWKFDKEASIGLKMLAEQGNTSKLEDEILKEYITGVRTIIKAKGQPDPNTPTHSMFRVTPTYHRISIVAAILPSPDWFLGIANLELCDISNNKWMKHITMNLYPLDAGTDSGKSFESPNDETMPPQPISRTDFGPLLLQREERPNVKLEHFARLKLNLVRTYEIRDRQCIVDNSVDVDEETPHRIETTPEPEVPIYNSGENQSPVSCDLTDWEEWLPCSGECEDGVIKGFQLRMRYHTINGVAVDQYQPNVRLSNMNLYHYCRNNEPMSETRECTEPCPTETSTITAD